MILFCLKTLKCIVFFYKELLALCEIIGVIGVKYIFEIINKIIYENIMKLKEIVVQNKDILQSLRISFDRPEMMKELYKRLDSMFLFFLFCIFTVNHRFI
jgi:hypothetical protein